jgi:integrase
VMRCAGDSRHGLRTRALIVVLWRAGLRISEAVSLTESDLDPSRGSILIRRGKGERRREGRSAVVRDRRTDPRATLVPDRRACDAAPARGHRRVRRRFTPHELRHAHAVEMARAWVAVG